MTQVHQVAIVAPLTAGAGATLCTIFIHSLALGATVNFFRRERRLGRAGMRYLIDLTIVVLVMSFAFVAHVIEIGVWAWLFMICGEFSEVWSRFLSLSGELYNARLWRCNHVAFMEVAGTTRGRRWITGVRGVDRDDFCRHFAID